MAAVPVGMESGSSFGNRIAALVTTLRYSQAISYARMTQRLSEVFGLEMSTRSHCQLTLTSQGSTAIRGGWDFSSAQKSQPDVQR
jgi:hypothetical protein